LRRFPSLSLSLVSVFVILISLLVPSAGTAQSPAKAKHKVKAVRPVLEANVRAEMESLADDAMLGRGSGTENELRAGEYIARQFKKFGVEPAGDNGANGKPGYLQTVPLTKQEFAAAPVLSVGNPGEAGFWSGTHGKEIAVLRAGGAKISGPLQKLRAGDAVKPGAIVYIHLGEGKSDLPVRQQMREPINQGAAAVIVADTEQIRKRFIGASKELPELPTKIGNGVPGFRGEPTMVILDSEATKHFDQATEGSTVQLAGELKKSEPAKTWNVVGVIKGVDPNLSQEAVLLTAHMDHLGVDPKLKGDQIYNGADDDASGVTAVLEMARALGKGPRPKRTIYFVTFGSEEKGGFGAQYFLQNPPVPLSKMAANLEFEMIGRPDVAVEAQTLWLTGYDRTNLGPELAKHGARLVADPHPTEQFFMRSDNYALALKGVVAQTVSSYGLHHDYHQVSDDIAHIDFAHMTRAINSMVEPVIWLVNSNFAPQWIEGKRP
jgi:aminopeptidase YwaD